MIPPPVQRGAVAAPLRAGPYVWVTSVACAIFLGYAGCFLYFFVDDEAIPLVFARNLLRGRGLVYTVLEGRTEGYSDFLHVMWSSVLLGVTRALGLSPLAPLLIGKAVSLGAGLAVVIVTARLLRQGGVTAAGLVAALGFLALAGPLAVWSCSSLETVTFALLVAAFAAALLSDGRTPAIILGVGLVLLRIDGVLYASTLLFAVIAAVPSRRSDAWRTCGWVALGAACFHGWRFLYFGTLLSAPLAAKVLYHLTATSRVMTKAPEVSYLTGFGHVYGLAAGAVLVGGAVMAWRAATARVAVIALVMLGLFVQIVGDWMFGWRFVVALLPMAAIVIGLAVSAAPRPLGWCLAAGVVLWSGVAARDFARMYVTGESRPIFWGAPRAGQAAWLGRYYSLLDVSRLVLHAGDRVAYNQAGLLPYVLDLENIDDLGICSGFVAHLPTTDVYFTGVGRYSPLTDGPVLRTAQAYLLYQDVQFLIVPIDLLLKANVNRTPTTLLNGLFTLMVVDASRENALYRRTPSTPNPYRRDPSLFTENLTHPSHLLHAAIDGRNIPEGQLGPALPFLGESTFVRTFTADLNIALTFGRNDADVSAFYLGDIASSAPATLTLSLGSEAGGEGFRTTLAIPAGHTSIYQPLPAGTRARAMLIDLAVANGDDQVTIADMRLEGQSAVLRDYVRRTLHFPAP